MLQKRSWLLIGLVIIILLITLFIILSTQGGPNGVFYSCYPKCNPIQDAIDSKMFTATLIAFIIIIIIIILDIFGKKRKK